MQNPDIPDSNSDEIVLPSQPIEVHIPDAEPDSAPVDGTFSPVTEERTPGAELGSELDDDAVVGEPVEGYELPLDFVTVDDDAESPTQDTAWDEKFDNYGQDETGEE